MMDEELKKRLEAEFLAAQNEPREKLKDFIDHPWKYHNLGGVGMLGFLLDAKPKKNEDET
jgi:hypothetical protein